MKKGYFLFTLLLVGFTFSNVNAQFVSVKDGSWRDAATWSTDPNASAIPDTNSTVYVSHNVIASAVSGTNSECYDLIINPTGTIDCNSSNWVTGSLEIRNDLINNGTINPGHDFYLTIGGNFYNNGITTRHYLSYVQRLSIMGNIYNNGSFHFSEVNFGDYRRANTSEHTHYIKSQNDSTIFLGTANFVDSLGTLIIDSLATLSATFNLNNSKIILPPEITHPNTLELVGGQIYGGEIIANGNTIQTMSVVALGRIQGDENNLIVKDAILEGHYRTGGRHDYYTTSLVAFEGETVLNGVIENIYSTSTLYSDLRGILIDGNFTNNGSLQNNIDDQLYINILGGNLINNGEIDAGAIKFYGECEFSTTDSISVNKFMGNDSNTVLNITSGDIIFKDKTVNVDFKGGTLNLPEGSNFFTTYNWSNTLQNINLNANNSTISFAHVGENAVITNPKCRRLEFAYNSILDGKIEVVENGTLSAYSESYPRIKINGNISNYGSIRNHNSRGAISLDIVGQVYHDGKQWSNTETKLNGIYDQAIIIPNDSSWTGKVVFDAMIEGTSYKWYKDNTPIDNAADRLYTLQNGISKSDYGQYYCETSAGNSRIITISGGSQEVVILEQKFDSVDEVKDWTVISNNSEYTWVLGNINDLNFNQIDPTSVSSAICPYVAADQDEYIVSPVFALGEGNAKLEFYAGYNSEWLANAKLKIMLVTNNGQDWNELWEFDVTTNGWEWKKFEIDLTPYANNTNIQLAWEYIGNDGDYAALDNVKVTGFETITGVEESNENIVPNNFELAQNYPNPFNPTTTISYSIPEIAKVELKIFDILGREVVTLINQEQNAGSYKVDFNASNLSSGVYFYRLSAGQFSETKKLLLLR